jgi:hypothetical protein
MKEFLFIFRRGTAAGETPLTPEQLQKMSKPWEDWMIGLSAKNKLSNQGHRLHPDGATVQPGSVITDGPYAETKEVVGGYSIIRADDLGEATEIAKGCPIFQVGGSVEVRELVIM